MRDAEQVFVAARGGDATQRIQDAIDRAASGPVRVVLEPGQHDSRGLRLVSDTELHLADGAELHFAPDYDAYAHTEVGVVAEGSNRAMIVARDAVRIALTGSGRIFGHGTRFSLGDDAEMGTRIPAPKRPRLLVLDSCADIRISGIGIFNSPMWTLHFVNCAGLDIEGVSVDNDRRMPNTDGIVIDACRDVRIANCTISTADDGIVLKTSLRDSGEIAGACERVAVRNCTVLSRSCALKVGTESFGPFRDLTFEDCRIAGSNRGLGLFSRDGGSIDTVRFARIALECEETPGGFWGSGEALTVNVVDRRSDERPAGTISNVVVEAVSGSMQGAINLYAERPGGIENVTVSGISIAQQAGPLGTGLSYDLRPTPADLAPSPDAAGRVNAWRKDSAGRIVGVHPYPGGMPGIYAHNVRGLVTADIAIARPDPLPESFHAETIVSD